MAAWLVGQIAVRDPVQWQVYLDRVGATISAYGGELIFRGEARARLAGDVVGERIVVVRFADTAALDAWHDSPAYQALVPIREAAADVVLTAYED
jgi:uncharacterized protein (DUF1330 family)